MKGWSDNFNFEFGLEGIFVCLNYFFEGMRICYNLSIDYFLVFLILSDFFNKLLLKKCKVSECLVSEENEDEVIIVEGIVGWVDKEDDLDYDDLYLRVLM